MTTSLLTGSEPFFIVLNTQSGRDDVHETQAIIERVMRAAGRRYEIMPVSSGQQLAELAQQAVQRARSEQGVVVAAGGDGTLSAVAHVVHKAGLPFGVLPKGTFNYFGRTYGIAQDTELAVTGLLHAQPESVQVGMVNDTLFLINASLGLYPTLLEDREAYKQRYGRSRWVALWSALVTLTRAHRQLTLHVEHEGKTKTLRTPTLVIGNNALQLEQIGIHDHVALEQGQLVAMGVKPIGTLGMYALVVRGWLSRLGDADQVFSFGFKRLVVSPFPRKQRVRVALDGEIHWLTTPVHFEVSDRPLHLLVPPASMRVDRA